MYLRDITFIYDGNTDYLDEAKTLVNFEKIELVAALVAEIEKYQSTHYEMYQVALAKTLCDPSLILSLLDYSPIDDTLHAYLLNVTYLDEESLHKQSLEREPPAGGVHTSSEEGSRTSIFDATGKLTKGPSLCPPQQMFVFT